MSVNLIDINVQSDNIQYPISIINIHVEADADARRLHKLLASFDMVTHVTGLVAAGGTLKLVTTFPDVQLDEVSVDPASSISDHSMVRCHLSMSVGPAPSTEHLARAWHRADRDERRRALERVRYVSQFQLTLTTHTTMCYVTSPTASLHCTRCGVQLIAVLPGSTPTVTMLVVTVVAGASLSPNLQRRRPTSMGRRAPPLL